MFLQQHTDNHQEHQVMYMRKLVKKNYVTSHKVLSEVHSTNTQVEDTQLSSVSAGYNVSRFLVAQLRNQLPLLSEKLGLLKSSMPID